MIFILWNKILLLLTFITLAFLHAKSIKQQTLIMANSNTILPLLKKLNNGRNIILASSSPRRFELMNSMGLTNFKVMKSSFEEDLDHSQYTADQYCLQTAMLKTQDVIVNLQKSNGLQPLGTIVIGADTIVYCQNEVLEKPKNKEDAYRMISLLSGGDKREHTVYTAVCIYSNGQYIPDSDQTAELINTSSFVEATTVVFASLCEEDKIAYVESMEGSDKSGGYGIQLLGGNLVEKINGCYFNIVGFPISRISKELAKLSNSKTI